MVSNVSNCVICETRAMISFHEKQNDCKNNDLIFHKEETTVL